MNHLKSSVSIKSVTYGVDAVTVALALFLILFGGYALNHGDWLLNTIIVIAIISILIVVLTELMGILKRRSFQDVHNLSKRITFILNEYHGHRINGKTALTEISDIVNLYSKKK